ncbi:hypothetical protein IMG5_070640 [Ichthyophthirius multifiliis]|uniref:Uncharacterized protein n=1 Tax=Ichthyophthirius multifiliis TaxID=5932 RepID=G0QPR7_ICHMU|nr:hypothetical protein IMG5_070640 [Ichthyophthirius multifiliis]EGR32782.1 hypothetical protein IMG5_070640 [Ichthyophthirius multifiliis]|eukprot:XP_004036768.1 hypothetical protein IMG5_070640 [Ichthyophthirius multifiliis]
MKIGKKNIRKMNINRNIFKIKFQKIQKFVNKNQEKRKIQQFFQKINGKKMKKKQKINIRLKLKLRKMKFSNKINLQENQRRKLKIKTKKNKVIWRKYLKNLRLIIKIIQKKQTRNLIRKKIKIYFCQNNLRKKIASQIFKQINQIQNWILQINQLLLKIRKFKMHLEKQKKQK